MSSSLLHLLPLFERELAHAHPMVLATVIRTEGPSYTKPGAQMLIAGNGEYAGLLSGGCLEGDLAERAGRVLRTGNCELARYDMRGPDDLLFGLGSGCEGAMDILLQRLDAEGDWQPMRRLAAAWKARRRERLLLVVPAPESDAAMVAQSPPLIGSGVFIDDGMTFGAHGTGSGPLSSGAPPAPGTALFLLELGVQPRILLLGAGTDALPVVKLAAFLGWSVTVVDHRSHFARAARFPDAETVIEGDAQSLQRLLRPAGSASAQFDAAIVMSHHLLTDAAYLRALAPTHIPYIGLLGPVVRRERLLAHIGADAARLHGRLRAPVGLDLGAASPEAIALSIVAEIQAALAGSEATAPLSAKSGAHAPSDAGDAAVAAGARSIEDERERA